MEPGFDDHFQKLIHQQAVAAHETSASIAQTCGMLGELRRGLICQGFTEAGAESIAHEMFVALADAAALGDDGDGE